MSLLVAVRVLTYNHDRYVRQCLESIQSQKTNFDFKVFIGEDSSTDNTLQICREFEINHPEKFVVKSTKENNILQNSLNNFDLCFNSGAKYIALCEGDDYWTDSAKLQKQIDFLEANEEYTGSFHYTKVKSQNEDYGKVYGKHDGQLNFEVKDTLSYYSLFHTSSFLFRSSALEIPKWFPHIQSADMALFSIVASKGPLRCIPEVMSIYRKHDGGITNTDAYLDIRYNLNRIKLLYYLDTFHNCIYHEKIEKLVDKHINEIRSCNEKKSILERVFSKTKKMFFFIK
jgi:glycosyltransferase involved in cell wall biosynthesis